MFTYFTPKLCVTVQTVDGISCSCIKAPTTTESPLSPLSPLGPVAPAGPVAPVSPLSPFGPCSNVGLLIKSL